MMHEAGQTFCFDLFSMFHKTGSCSTLYFASLCKLLHMKTKPSDVHNAHADCQASR